MENVNTPNIQEMEISIYNDPLYKALKSAKVDERLAVDAVINRSVFNPNLVTKEDLKLFATKEDLKLFATKEDLFAFKAELKEDISSLREDIHSNTIKLMKWMTTIIIGSTLGGVTVIVALLKLLASI